MAEQGTSNAAPDDITKVTQIIQRADGSEVRICATAMFGIGLACSIDVYVHRRDSAEYDWELCSDRPHKDWRTMSRENYIKYGRSKMLRAVSHAEILKLTGLIGQPILASTAQAGVGEMSAPAMA